jgi:hypothetical protein
VESPFEAVFASPAQNQRMGLTQTFLALQSTFNVVVGNYENTTLKINEKILLLSNSVMMECMTGWVSRHLDT